MGKLLKITILLLIAYVVFVEGCDGVADKFLMRRVQNNYGKDIEKVCQTKGYEAEYFKALVLLECSGNKPAKPRFEEHVYEKLKNLKRGHIKKYGNLSTIDLKGYSDAHLKKLATSWGPMQIMGYHTIKMRISIADLQGDKAIEYSIRWCIDNYGAYLRRSDYRNAFHIHNTGRPFPKNWFGSQTFDPNYVPNGLRYTLAFKLK